MTPPRSSADRHEGPERRALHQLQHDHPEIAKAVTLELELLETVRRVQGRVPLPRLTADAVALAEHAQSGQPVFGFTDVPLEWTDVRLTLRQCTDILARHEVIADDAQDYCLNLAREAEGLPAVVASWFAESAAPSARSWLHAPAVPRPDGADQVLLLALRPYLGRCADWWTAVGGDLRWPHRHCPSCGGEPDLGALATDGGRALCCGRCTTRWRAADDGCPYCGVQDPTQHTTFTTPDGRYGLTACDVCQRYLKWFDERRGGRALMPRLDAVATLGLDAAAVRRGYC